MVIAQAFRVQRLTLSAGVVTPIRPPATFATVSIGNGTAGDLQVHTSDDLSEYLVIAAGFERAIPVSQPGAFLAPSDQPVFWLKAIAGGLVVLLWTI